MRVNVMLEAQEGLSYEQILAVARRATPRLAARFADELGGVFFSPAECAVQRRALDRACETVGRDPCGVTYSLMSGLLVGDSAADLERRARRLQPELDHAGSTDGLLDALAERLVPHLPTPEPR